MPRYASEDEAFAAIRKDPWCPRDASDDQVREWARIVMAGLARENCSCISVLQLDTESGPVRVHVEGCPSVEGKTLVAWDHSGTKWYRS